MADIDGGGLSTDALSPADTPATPARYPGILTASLVLATFLQSLDNTIANVALPHMQGTLSATQDEMGWVLTSYMIAAAITIPLSGWLANQFGRRRVFLTSIILFTAASVLCGMAETLPEIVLCRFLQGVGGAALVPLSQAVLFDINAPKNFARAMSIWSAGANLGPITGPILGGWLTENYNWRWVFYINVPVGIIAFLGLFLTMPERQNAKSARFDFFGFGMLSVSIASFQLFLDRGQLLDWFSSREIVIEAGIAGLGFYLFLVHTFSSAHPFLNPALFKDRNFAASIVFIFVFGIVFFATLALLPPMLQNQMHYPVVLTGLVTAPRAAGMLTALFIMGRISARIDPRVMMGVGLGVSAYALWLMAEFSLQMGWGPVLISGVLQGFGLGLVYVPLATVAFTTLSGTLRNEGTAFFNLLRNVGSSIGISVVMFLLTQNTQRLHASLGAHLTPYNIIANPAAIAAHVDATSIRGLVALNAMITNQATMIAYIDDFWLMTMLTLLTMPLLLFIRVVRGAKAVAGSHPAALE